MGMPCLWCKSNMLMRADFMMISCSVSSCQGAQPLEKYFVWWLDTFTGYELPWSHCQFLYRWGSGYDPQAQRHKVLNQVVRQIPIYLLPCVCRSYSSALAL